MVESTAQAIVNAVGGPENIDSLTHCATRLRFQLVNSELVDGAALDSTEGVMGAVPQAGNRYQVIIGGAVAGVFQDINNLPSMKSRADKTAEEIKAEARAKGPRGKNVWMDSFFEYLADSFRPILGVLLGASLIIAFAAVMDAFGVQDFRAEVKPAGWQFLDTMWRSVFYFLPIMVAYNAAKKLNVDPWLGAAIMGSLMTPEFIGLTSRDDIVCTTNVALGTESCQVDVFGVPLLLSDYGGNVFVPLMMAALLALVYHNIKKVVPESLQLVFLPFLSMVIMIPITGFILGPLGVWLGGLLGTGLAWLNTTVPLIFAILIPMIYPFLVPLGLHWPLNALMLMNIDTLGYDFIQGPMGAWNFACFGATAGVLVLSMRERDTQMRQTSTGALVAGLFGGISEPSLYGIHLRFARIYPRMLVGCFVGGLTIGLGSMFLGTAGVTASAFAFTSLLTIPLFSPMFLYVIAIALAFFTAMALVVITDYRTPEQKAEALARIAKQDAEGGPHVDILAEEEAQDGFLTPAEQEGVTDAEARPFLEEAQMASAVKVLPKTDSAALAPGATVVLDSPLEGTVVPLADVPDPGFASGAVGAGVAIDPTSGILVAPGSARVLMTFPTGHAVGLKMDSGVELLIHIGIDTVNLKGAGFKVLVTKGDLVSKGDPLVEFDIAAIKAAGYSAITPVLVTNRKRFAAVEAVAEGVVATGDALLSVTAKEAR
ncbi:glucose PTS transporter subunit IIA [Actinomyces minihominis]|uniref:glucose PTS transporter subunit IIA n=1 Tax=Actinomyces minihominis TaxID=2002838 RepID=UPI000C07F0A9|nr:glucose PTS transporter subunit IIA [Actinomyces minihominis]